MARKIVAATPARVVFEAGLAELGGALDTLDVRVRRGDSPGARTAFEGARGAYKRVEGLLLYYGPGEATALNGPVDDEGDDAVPMPLGSPAAFQRVEDAVFTGDLARDSVRMATAHTVDGMREIVGKFATMTRYLNVGDIPTLEAARLELARVTTLDLAGFDSERDSDAVREGAEALEGLRRQVQQPDVDSALGRAVEYLRHNADFDRMDRLTFIAAYEGPAARAIQRARTVAQPNPPPVRRTWRDRAASLFDSDAFDPTAYGVSYATTPRPSVVALGAKLFVEPRLSGTGTRSCAFCHEPNKAFTDGRVKRSALEADYQPSARETPARNVPTLLNSALQRTLFADGRAASLEEQVGDVLRSRSEMHSSAELAADRLQGDTTYQTAFAGAFDVTGGQAVNGERVRIALAAYVRTLTTMNSRFDFAARGDTAALTAAERRGFTTFMGKGRCGSCHFAPLFNGTMPPAFTTSEPEIIGVPERPALRHARIDPDPGRAGIDQVKFHRYAFKVPTVRNVELTAPYMHNGAYATLEQVVDFYNAGGGVGVGTGIPYQTLPTRALHLTRGERADLIAFLRALTDTTLANTTVYARR